MTHAASKQRRLWPTQATSNNSINNLKVAHDTDQVRFYMDRKMKLELLLEHLEEEAGYLSNLCEGARKALDNNPEHKDDCGNGYPFLYGYVASGVNHHGGEINRIVKDLKELLYEGSDRDKDLHP